MTDEIRILKKASCPTLSGKSKLSYQIGSDPESALYVRIAENTGGGFFSQEWVPVKAIEQALAKTPDAITSVALFQLFKGKSVNTPAFLLAVLKHEGVVQAVKGRQRKHMLVDIGQLTGTGKAPATKKAPVKKKATPKRSRQTKA